MTDYAKLSYWEIDALVAERVMGNPRPVENPREVRPDLFYGRVQGVPWIAASHGDGKFFWISQVPYSTDDNAARMVRERIAELGLEEKFVEALDAQIPEVAMSAPKYLFTAMQTLCRQQAIAALIAKEGK